MGSMDKKYNIRIEALMEIFDEHGISATAEQVASVVNDFSRHIEMEEELSYYRPESHKEECQKCKSLEHDLDNALKDIETYNNSVKERRNASSVWIENGEVRYER